jgi:hypothetical protein
MIRDIASPIGFVKLHSRTPERLLLNKQVFHMSIAPERNHVWMLHKQKLIRNQALLPFADQSQLHSQSLGIPEPAEMLDLAATH